MLNMQQEITKQKEERKFFEKSIESLNKALDYSNREYDRVSNDFEKISTLYNQTLKDKAKNDQ